MEKTPADRAYIKKHKINDLLNDLYISLLKEKPDNPTEFIVNKLDLSKSRKNSVDNIKKNVSQVFGSLDKNAISNLLAAKKEPDLNSNDIIDSSPLRKIQIFNNIKRILVSQTHQMTEEDLLKQEEINPYTRKYDESEEPDNPLDKEITLTKILRNREEFSLKSREQLKKIIDDAKLESSDKNEQKKDIDQQEKSNTRLYEEEGLDEELFGSIKKKSSKKNVKKTKIRDSLIYKPQINRMLVQSFICKICSKAQRETNEENDFQKTDVRKSASIRPIDGHSNHEIQLGFNIEFLKQSLANNLLTKRTNLDENIESASQISGPRGPLEKFEAKTSRSQIEDVQNITHAHDSIMAWVLARQNAPKETLSASFIKSDSTKKEMDNQSDLKSRQTPLWSMVQSSDDDDDYNSNGETETV